MNEAACKDRESKETTKNRTLGLMLKYSLQIGSISREWGLTIQYYSVHA